MWKLIKLELVKSKLKLALLIILVGTILAPFLTGMMSYDDYSVIAILTSIFGGLYCFKELYIEEKKNKTLKISVITPVGMKKVIEAKVILAIVSPIAIFIMSIVVISMLINPQYLILEIPSIITGLLFVINFVIIGIYLTLIVFKGKSNIVEFVVAGTSVILIKLIRDINITHLTMIGIGTVILIIMVILFKLSLLKSILAEDII